MYRREGVILDWMHYVASTFLIHLLTLGVINM